MTNSHWVSVVLSGLIIGYALGPGTSAIVQREPEQPPGPTANQEGALNRVDGVHQPPEFKSTIPAPMMPHGARTMWPNQPNESTFWSIDDIKKAHVVLSAAATKRQPLDPNSALHHFPYWTRTHGMFINHLSSNATRRPAEQHLGYAQFIVVMGGTGSVTAGGQLTNPSPLKEKGMDVFGELRGSGIVGGETFVVKEGDWVSIPANSPAQFRAAAPDGLTYMVMKIPAQLYPWDLIR